MSNINGLLPDIVAGPPETVTLTVTAPLKHLCPFVSEEDEGAVTIKWSTCGNTIELHSLARYFRDFRLRIISHEDLTDEIRSDLEGLPGIYALSVATEWTTAGMDISCSTWPIPAARP